MQQERYDVLVIGGGVIGCSVAYYLASVGVRVALVERGALASEASLAGAGMLAPLAETAALDASTSSEGPDPFLKLCLAGLHCYDELDEQLKGESGIDIELLDTGTLRPAFTEDEAVALQQELRRQQQYLSGLQWLDAVEAGDVDCLLPENLLGALLSPQEGNVNPARLTQAYARAAAAYRAAIFEGRPAEHLLRNGTRVVGVDTAQGPIYAEHIVLAAGAWSSRWHHPDVPAPIFPVKGQMLAVCPILDEPLQHIIYHHQLGYLVPKADGSVYVGATSERCGFEKSVTVEGMQGLLTMAGRLAPSLKLARFERAWAGLRPGTLDGYPLLGACASAPGLWLASGHFRNGILLGPLTGHIMAALIQGHPVPFDLDLEPFDPDRFGGWDTLFGLDLNPFDPNRFGAWDRLSR